MKKYFIVISLLLSLSYQACAKEKIKLYAMYTPSHQLLKDEWFLPSIQDDYEIVIDFYDQECPSAQFREKGWTKTTHHKVDLIIRAIKENWNKVFIYSDVDIQFFEKTKHHILKAMHNNDMVIQRNCPAGVVCSGFFACRGNKKTLHLWQQVKRYMTKHTDISDQATLNHVLNRKYNSCNVTWDFLPNSFFNAGTLTGKRWSPGQSLHIPEHIILHHANWTVGIENKIAQLHYVKDKINPHSTS